MSTNPAIQINKARALAQAGKTAAARKAYKSSLGPRPSPDLLVEFAMFEANGGHLANAKKLLVKASRLAPTNPDILINLGEIYRLAENHKDAALALKKACELTGEKDADALYLLAEAERNLGELDAAETHASAAQALSPQDAEIAISQALIQMAKGETDRAITHYQRALDIAPGNYEVASNLAYLHFQQEHWQSAADAFDIVSKLGPLSPQNLLNHIDALIYVERGVEAVEMLASLDTSSLDEETLHLAYSSALTSTGQFDEAEIHLRKLLEIEPNDAVAYEKLATINKLKPEDEPFLSNIANSAQSDQERIRANFALYQLLKKGAADEAFTALETANQLIFSQNPFDYEAHLHALKETVNMFSADIMHERTGQGDDREGPIFIFGMPRSGTTLVETILGAHEGVHAGGERTLVRNFANTEPDYPYSLSEKSADWAREKGAEFYHDMFADAPDARFVTDKLPGNYVNIGLIGWLLPKAKLVYCRRDAMDTCFSCYEQHFRSGLRFAYDLTALGQAYAAHSFIMKHWLENSPLSIHIVDYEKLVTDSESVIKHLVDFCGLNFDKKSVDPSQSGRSIATASAWQARQPINAGSVKKWARFEEQLRPLKEALEASEVT